MQGASQVVSGNTPATSASGLTGTADANCTIDSETKLHYRSTAAPVSATNPTGCTFCLPDPVWNIGANATTVPAQPVPATTCFKPYTVGVSPTDLATTTTDSGVTAPFIVRVARGTLNRGIYDLAVLIDPTRPWAAIAPQAGWNGKVYCTYPDSETTTMEVNDCVMLIEAYQKPGLQALWAGLTQDQINARKAAINGHVDQTACHAWYNAFGSNGRAGVYQQRLVSNNTTGAPLQCVVMGRVDLGPGHGPGGRPRHARQRRRAVRPEGLHRGLDHRRRVLDAE